MQQWCFNGENVGIHFWGVMWVVMRCEEETGWSMSQISTVALEKDL